MDPDTGSPVIGERRPNRIGTAAGVLGIAAALGFSLVVLGGYSGFPFSLILVPAILAIILGAVGTMKGRRGNLPIGMAVAGLSLGLLSILLFVGLILLLLLAWGF